MKKKHEQNLSCTFAEQLAAYLYDEIAGAEKNSFELHLQNCEICANELTDFSALRSSILNWRENDFASLQTPSISLPALRETVEENRSWATKLWESFTLAPTRAVFASLVILILLTGLLWFASGSLNREELADLSNSEKETVNQQQSQIKDETISRATPSAKENIAQDARKKSVETVASAPKSTLNKNRDLVEKRIATTMENESAISVTQKISNRQIASKKTANSKIKVSNQNDTPAMADDDDDDDSLRLTDLFDEVGMSDPDKGKESK